MEFRVFLGASLCSVIFLTIFRFILKSKVPASLWEKRKGKYPWSRWVLWGVRDELPAMLFWWHILLDVALLAFIGLYLGAYFALAYKTAKFARTALLYVLVASVLSLEPTRHFNRR